MRRRTSRPRCPERRAALPRHAELGALLLAGCVAVLLPGCSAAPASRPPRDATRAPGGTDAATELGVAAVDAALHAHVLLPSESLAVRLLGTIGPDGNWSLAKIAVERTASGVRIVPYVRKGTARQVIQMLIPLDSLVWVPLPVGTHTVEVHGRDSTFVDRVRVGPDVTRRAPETRLSYKIISSGLRSQDFVGIDAIAGDGFIEAIEVRETRAAGVGAWRRLEGCQRTGPNLEGRVAVPEKDDLITVEARAVDGQGDRDPEPGLINLR